MAGFQSSWVDFASDKDAFPNLKYEKLDYWPRDGQLLKMHYPHSDVVWLNALKALLVLFQSKRTEACLNSVVFTELWLNRN